MFYRARDVEIHPDRFEIRRGGAPVPIPRLAFDFILHLLRHRDRPLSRSEILSAVWSGRTVTEDSLTQVVAIARKALGDDPVDSHFIRTLRGRGYWWVAETQEVVGAAAGSAPFVGRDGEVRRIKEWLSDAASGHGRLVLVVGEAGIGKSRLVEVLSEHGLAVGMWVLKAFADDLERVPPLYLWRQIASAAAQGAPELSNPLVLGGAAPAFQTGSGIDSDVFAASTVARARLHGAVVSLISDCATKRPILLVLEDLHNADVSSLQALRLLASSLTGLRVLVLATQRSQLVSADDRARHELALIARQRAAQTVLLGSLSGEAVQDFLRVLSDPTLPIGVAATVSRACGGNPFLLWQIVGLARARGVVQEESDLVGLPGTIRSAITLHARELPAECYALLRTAAVIGQVFDSRILAEVARSSPGGLLQNLDVAVGAGILRVRGVQEFEFAHALLREALYEDTEAYARATIHLGVANAMLQVFGSDSHDRLPTIAAHFRDAAAVGGRPNAIALLVRCGERASRELGFGDAVRFFEEAFRLERNSSPAAPDQELRLLLSLGSARLCDGDRKGAAGAFEKAAALATAEGRAEPLAEAALGLAPRLLSIENGVVDPTLISLLERALTANEGGERSLRLQLMGRLALALYWTEQDERRQRLTAMLERALREETDASLRSWSLLMALGANWGPDSLVKRHRVLADLNRAPRCLPASLNPVVRVFRFATSLEIGEIESLDSEIDLLKADLASAPDLYGSWYPLMLQCTQLLRKGNYAAVLRLAPQYLAAGKGLGDRNVLHSFAAQVAEAQWITGGAREALPEAMRLAAQFENMPEWSSTVAFFMAVSGRDADAAELAKRLVRSGFLESRRNLSFSLAVCALAEVVSRLKVAELAAPLFEALRPYRGRNAVAGFGVISWGSISRFMGQLAGVEGRYLDAEQLLAEAISQDTAAGSNPWLARSEIALAGVLAASRARGAAARSRAWARKALTRARSLGLSQLEKDAAQFA